MNIARIVSSNSHIDYVARVIDRLDVNDPPQPSDHCFGQFVAIDLGGGERAVGVIYDSKLVNPEYASFGPRLSPRPALGNFSPDFIAEQGILIGILLVGTLDKEGRPVHGVPRRVVPPGQEVERLEKEAVRKFHSDANRGVHLHYYSQVIAHAGPFAVPLLDSIIDELCVECTEAERQRLNVLKQSLLWQGTFGGMRL
jgi:hypothetical protein